MARAQKRLPTAPSLCQWPRRQLQKLGRDVTPPSVTSSSGLCGGGTLTPHLPMRKQASEWDLHSVLPGGG